MAVYRLVLTASLIIWDATEKPSSSAIELFIPTEASGGKQNQSQSADFN
jgi:hypothetical protein